MMRKGNGNSIHSACDQKSSRSQIENDFANHNESACATELLVDTRGMLTSALEGCSDADLLFELEGAVDDAREFAALLGLDDVAKGLCGLSKRRSLSIKGVPIELLSNHTLTLVVPNSAREEFSSLTCGELSELYGLEYVKVELVFAN